jgi:hypothetical protein
MAKAHTIYLIQRRLTAGEYGVFSGAEGQEGVPVLACPSAQEAEERRRQLEEEARRVMAPFLVANLKGWSSVGVDRLRARLEALGLRDLPEPAEEWQAEPLWRRWWDEHGEEVTAEQRAAIWELFDKLRFYEVVPVKLKG